MADCREIFNRAEESLNIFDFESAMNLYKEAIQELSKLEDNVSNKSLKVKALKQIGEILWMKGATQKSIGIYTTAFQIASEINDSVNIIQISLNIAQVYFLMNNIAKASEYLEKALETAETAGSDIYKAEVLYNIGKLKSKEGDSAATEENFRTVEDILKPHMGDISALKIIAGIFTQRGLMFFRMGEYEEAVSCYEHSLKLLENQECSLEKAEAYRYLGVIYSIKQDYINTLKNHGQALKIYKKSGYLFGQAKIYSSIGQTYLGIEDLDRSIYFLKKSARLYVELKSNSDLAAIYSKLGDVYLLMKKYELAVKYYLKDLKISRQLENQHGLAYTYKNLGSVYRLMGEPAQVHTYLMRSIELFEKFQDQRNIAAVYNELALSYIETGDYEQGKEFADAAVEVYEATGRAAGMGRVQMLYGMLCKGLQHWDEAVSYFEESIKTLTEAEATADTVNSFYELSRLYLEMKDKENAMTNLRAAYQLADEHDLESQVNKVCTLIEEIDETEMIQISIERLCRNKAKHNTN
jgi:tetratricopeptide (TPR) repeat protein